MFGSSVVPDFDDTTKIVRLGSLRAAVVSTADGSVESRTSTIG